MKKMKLKLSAISVILIFAMIFGSLVSCGEPNEPADTTQNETTEQLETVAKEHNDYNVDMDFFDNMVVVVSQPYMYEHEYTVEDFSDIGCIEISRVSKNPNKKTQIIWLVLDKHSRQNVLDAISILEQRPDVVRADPYGDDKPCIVENDENAAIPDDAYYQAGAQWAPMKIKLPAAWNIETGSTDVLVGVIDTGVDGSHPDLAGRINVGLSRCFTDDFTNPLEDIHGHGTHVAGIIGAAGDNTVGISGACWNIKIVSLRVATEEGGLSRAGLADAIEYAEEKGIKILNYSGGGVEYDRDVFDAISNYSGIFICAAGNTGVNNDTTPFYPASYNYNNIISVGNSTETDSKASSSCYGQNSVDLFAPGTSILSCYPTSLCASCTTHYATGYHYMSGTSMAAPYVTGVAALLLSHQSNLTASGIKKIILDNVDEVSSLSTYCVTGGRLNANSALRDSYIHRSHTMVLDTDYEHPDKHRYRCTGCLHSDYDAHTWTLVQTGPNGAPPQDASVDYIPRYECTVCGYVGNYPSTGGLVS